VRSGRLPVNLIVERKVFADAQYFVALINDKD
jgi:hypothetical protein